MIKSLVERLLIAAQNEESNDKRELATLIREAIEQVSYLQTSRDFWFNMAQRRDNEIEEIRKKNTCCN